MKQESTSCEAAAGKAAYKGVLEAPLQACSIGSVGLPLVLVLLGLTSAPCTETGCCTVRGPSSNKVTHQREGLPV